MRVRVEFDAHKAILHSLNLFSRDESQKSEIHHEKRHAMSQIRDTDSRQTGMPKEYSCAADRLASLRGKVCFRLI